VLLALAGCSSGPERAPAIGEGYVGALELPVRKELTARAEVVETAKYGQRVEILGKRRRFMKVRTEKGAEGWVDARQLFNQQDIENLKALAERAAQSPSQGEATVFDVLNVHSAPNRQAPSFFQIQPEERVDVIVHQRAPRVPFVPPELITAELSRQRPVQKKKKKETGVPPPPPPRQARPPDNWLGLSGHPELEGLDPDEALEKLRPARAEAAQAATVFDDWTLVRAKDGRSGWALARMLFLAVPDEVAQYAERARIVAYFATGKKKDAAGAEHADWLWATMAKREEGVHFDSLRLFTYNLRRKRYETAFIDRKASGWLPIELQRNEAGAVTGFTVVVRENDGRALRRTYTITGDRVRLAGRTEAEAPQDWYVVSEKGGRGQQTLPASPGNKGLVEKAGQLLEQIKKRVGAK
jgi:predicted lipoprotein with Yx(FWY)xxD motif